MTKTIGYARVSTKKQSLAMQKRALKQGGCDKIYSDHGKSGRKAERPGLDKALLALEPGDCLVVWKLDRLGRSVHHLSELLLHFDREGIHFRSISDGLDTTTALGKMTYHIYAAVAQFYCDLISENTIEGLETARENGRFPGRRPKLNADDLKAAHMRIKVRKEKIKDVASDYGVAGWTLTRGFRRIGLETWPSQL